MHHIFKIFKLVLTILSLTIVGCTSTKKIATISRTVDEIGTRPEQSPKLIKLEQPTDANQAAADLSPKSSKTYPADTTFVNIRDFSNEFMYKMKYAGEDNFMKAKVYDCEACYLRYRTAKALIKANEKFMKKGYRIIIYDCYRPLSIQYKMWEIVPNPIYVADPRKGSIHNRGGAVDIGLADLGGKELDMGTPFDHFGIEASHDYEFLSDEVKENRKLLRKIMTQNDFRIFESEWWHYNIKNTQKIPLANFKWDCD